MVLENNHINKIMHEIDLNCNPLNSNQNYIGRVIEELKITPQYPIILVGGTNGKGSVCAYLTNILINAGYKVGCFTSPHIFKYNERICINNNPVSDDVLEKTISNFINYQLGVFQVLTLAMHQIFISNSIDIAIVEVGIGGKHDVTNFFEPEISAITCVDFDHCYLLGNNLEEIGLEKAGIFRENKWSFYGAKNPPQSVIKHAQQIQSKLQTFGVDFGITTNELSFNVWCNNETGMADNFYTLPYPLMRGKEQITNVALAISILNKLKQKFPIDLSTIKRSILQTRLIGRFQIIPNSITEPQIVLDVAHNPQAVLHMLQNMLKLPFAKQNYAVFGVANDKDVANIIKICVEYFDKWFIAPLASKRSLGPKNIANILLSCGVKEHNIVIKNTISEALTVAQDEATMNHRIVAFGSFLVVEESYSLIRANI